MYHTENRALLKTVVRGTIWAVLGLVAWTVPVIAGWSTGWYLTVAAGGLAFAAWQGNTAVAAHHELLGRLDTVDHVD